MKLTRPLDPAVYVRARALRRSPTLAERCLWDALRGRRLGWKFRRQHPLGRYILDFFCVELRLAIELDGEVHAEEGRRAYDAQRTAELARMGVAVVRFDNSDVIGRIASVLQSIATVCEERTMSEERGSLREHR